MIFQYVYKQWQNRGGWIGEGLVVNVRDRCVRVVNVMLIVNEWRLTSPCNKMLVIGLNSASVWVFWRLMTSCSNETSVPHLCSVYLKQNLLTILQWVWFAISRSAYVVMYYTHNKFLSLCSWNKSSAGCTQNIKWAIDPLSRFNCVHD